MIEMMMMMIFAGCQKVAAQEQCEWCEFDSQIGFLVGRFAFQVQ